MILNHATRWRFRSLLLLFTAFATVVAATLVTPSETFARQYVDMGVKDDAAIYQPMVTIEVLTNDASETSLGPGTLIDGFGIFGNSLLLDTGASSIIAMNDAETTLKQNGFTTEGEVFELGVAGTSILDVSAPYKIDIAGSDGITYRLDNARIQSGQFPGLFGFNGLVGMPGMLGRHVKMETFPPTGGGDIFDRLPNAEVTFPSSLPASSGHRYTIPLTAKSFNLTEADTIGPNGVEGQGPLPIQAPLPMISPTVGFGDRHASGQFLLDTGAQISFISSKIALSLGLDSNGDGKITTSDDQSFGSLPIGGIGGQVDAPLFLIDTFRVHTEQDVDLVWNAAQVLVLDIHPDIDGVLGSDVLTSGWVDILNPTPGTGPIKQVHMDFSQFFAEGDTGQLHLDLDTGFDTVLSSGQEGDFDTDGDTDGTDFALWAGGYGTELGARLVDGDDNVDGDVDGSDFLRWQRNVLTSSLIAGDFDSDGDTDAADFALWSGGYGTEQGALRSQGDDNTDGDVDGSDFLRWQHRFQPSTTLAAVPEPSSLAMLAIAATMLGLRSKRRA